MENFGKAVAERLRARLGKKGDTGHSAHEWKRSALPPDPKGCDHSSAQLERTDPRGILRCLRCMVAFPAKEHTADAVQSEHWSEDKFREQYKLDRGWIPSHWDALMCRAVFLHGSGIILQDPPNRRALDVGCGAGFFLKLLNGYFDYETWGTEPSEWGCRFAAAQLELKNVIRAETPAAAGLQDDFFGFVSLIHTLEHVPDPLELLKDIYRVCAPGALFYGEVPDSDFLNDWHQTEHRWFFNEESLDYYLRCAGFKVLRIFAGRNLPWPEPIPFLGWAAQK